MESTDRVRQIIQAYVKDRHSTEPELEFAEWFADPRRSVEKDRALAELWNSFSLGKTESVDSALLRMKIRLGHPLLKKRRIPRWISRVAAVLVPVAIILTTFLLVTRTTPDVPKVSLALQAADSMLYYVLPDNSELWLNSNSSLTYTETADGSRHAELRGEACFRVTRNGFAFDVEVPDLTVKVLGTEFNVREDADVTEVMLYEGSVEVVVAGSSIPMTPGTMLTYRDGEFSTGPISKDHINWRYAMLNFQGDDISTILERVCRFYGLDLEIPAEGLPADPLTIRFDGREPLDHTMFLLWQLSGRFDYELNGDTMTVTPR